MVTRCSAVTAGDVNIVVALSIVAGKSPLLPSQKDRFQREMLSGGMVVRAGPGICSAMLRSCVSSAIRTHGLLSVRCSEIARQSTSLPLALMTVGRSPWGVVVMGSVVVGMKGLCGIVSWIVVA